MLTVAISSLLLAQLAQPVQPPLPATPVTLTIPSAPAARVARELGKAVGLEVTVTPSLDSDVWAVRVKDVPFDHLAAKVRTHLRASISRTEHGLLFTREESEWRAMLEEQEARHIRRWRDFLSELAPLGEWDRHWATKYLAAYRELGGAIEWPEDPRHAIIRLGHGSPFARAAHRLLAAVPVAELASAFRRPGVYSNRPTKAQRPIPNGDEVLRALAIELSDVIAALPAQQPEAHEGDFPGEPSGPEAPGGPGGPPGPSGPPEAGDLPWQLMRLVNTGIDLSGELTLLVTVSQGFDRFPLTVSLYGQDGKLIVSNSPTFANAAGERNWGLYFQGPIDEPAPPEAVRRLEEINARLDPAPLRAAFGDPSQGATPEVAEWSRRASQVDPLAGPAWMILEQASAALGVQLLASLPDKAGLSNFSWLLRSALPEAGVEPPTLAAMLALSDQAMDYAIEDGWLLATPADPVEAIEGRVNRAASDRFAATLPPHGIAGFWALADLMAQHRYQALELANPRVFAELPYQWTSPFYWQAQAEERKVLGLFGLFEAGARARLMRGETLDQSALSPRQWELLRNTDIRHSLWTFSAGPVPDRFFREVADDDEVFERMISLAGQPTVAFPDGVRPETSVAIRIRSMPRVIGLVSASGVVRGDRVRGDPYPAMDVISLLRVERSSRSSVPASDRFALVEMLTGIVRLTAPYGVPFEMRTQLIHIPGELRWLRFEELPEDLRRQVREIQERQELPVPVDAGDPPPPLRRP